MPILIHPEKKVKRIKLVDRSVKTNKKRPWVEHKKNAMLLADSFERIGKTKKAVRVDDCGDVLVFSGCPSGHERKLKKATFCRIRLCPMCSWRKSLKVAGQVQKIAHIASKTHKLRWVFITLTCANVEGYELPDRLDQMMKGWHSLVRSVAYKSRVLGSFRSMEVTRNSDILSESYNTYHPHFHAVLAVPPSYFSHSYLKTDEWVQIWREALGVDYDPIVDVRTVRKKSNTEKGEVLSGEAVAELAKYVTKAGDYLNENSKDQTDEAVQILDVSLKSRRLHAYGGILKDIYEYLKKNGDIEDVESDSADLIHTEDEEMKKCNCSVCGSTFRDEIYKWLPGRKNYFEIEKDF